MSKSKLEQVMEYLINDREDKAKEILHQLFIEKARAIHEELIEMDDDTIPGDEGDEFEADIHDHSDHLDNMNDEIDSEENLEEAGEEEISLDDAVDDISDSPEDMDDDDDDNDDDDMSMDKDDEHEGMSMDEIEDTMHDLEAAFDELKAEFKSLESNDDEHMDDEDEDMDDENVEDDEEDHDDNMDDKDDLDEDWADLEESLDLDVITSNIYGPGSKSSMETGSGGKSVNVNTKSPVPMSQKDRFGAKPTDPDKGPVASGYKWTESGYVKKDNSPLSGMSDNRRKKSTDGMTGIGSSYGKTKEFNSKLERDSDFPSDTLHSKGPLSTAPKK